MPTAGNGDTTNNPAIKGQQFQLLGDIQIVSFVANPSRLQPFQKTTISYQVKLPTALKVPVKLAIGTQAVNGLHGSADFTLTSTTPFHLFASTELVSRSIATLTVTVDQSECRPGSISGLGLAAVIKANVDQSFTGRLRGNGSTVLLGAGTISIAVPLTLGGTRTMDIDIELAVAKADQNVSISSTVTVKVNLDTAPDVDSWCSNASAKIVQPFMLHIVEKELVPAMHQQLMDQINGLISSAEKTDRLRRQFALTSFALTSDGVTFMVCPTTPDIVATTTTVSRQ